MNVVELRTILEHLPDDLEVRVAGRANDPCNTVDRANPNRHGGCTPYLVLRADKWRGPEIALQGRFRRPRVLERRLDALTLAVQGEPQEATSAVSAVGGAPGVSETHTDPKEAPVNEDERWGAEPTIDAPEGTSWDGPWRRAKRYYPADDDDTAELVWARDALEHDDHEDCCHHTRHVTIAVTTRENQA